MRRIQIELTIRHSTDCNINPRLTARLTGGLPAEATLARLNQDGLMQDAAGAVTDPISNARTHDAIALIHAVYG